MATKKMVTEKIKGTWAKLVESSKDLDVKIKKLTEELKENKAKLKEKFGANILLITNNNAICEIKGQDAYTDPSPKEIYKAMKDRGLEKEFFSIVKVNIADAKTYFPDEELNQYRKKTEPIIKISFK